MTIGEFTLVDTSAIATAILKCCVANSRYLIIDVIQWLIGFKKRTVWGMQWL